MKIYMFILLAIPASNFAMTEGPNKNKQLYDQTFAKIKKDSYINCTQKELIEFFKIYMHLRSMLSINEYNNAVELRSAAKSIYDALKHTFPGDQETKKRLAKRALDELADDFSDDESMYAKSFDYEAVYCNSKNKTDAITQCTTLQGTLRADRDIIHQQCNQQNLHVNDLEVQLRKEKEKLDEMNRNFRSNQDNENRLEASIDLLQSLKDRNAEHVRSIKLAIEEAITRRNETIRTQKKALVDLECNQRTPGKSDPQYESKKRILDDEILGLNSQNAIDKSTLDTINARLLSIDTPATYQGIAKRAALQTAEDLKEHLTAWLNWWNGNQP